MNNQGNNQNVFFENNSWHCRRKCINEALNTEFVVEGGYATEEAAIMAYAKYTEEYNNKIAALQKNQSGQISFREHLTLWYHKIYVPRSDRQTQVVAAYVLYHFLLPSMPESLQNKTLPTVTLEDLNKLLSACNDFCDTSGAQTYKFLRSFFYDSFLDGYIKENLMENATKYYFNKYQKEIIVYTKEKIKNFLEFAYARYPQHFFDIYSGIVGLRCGEIRGLNTNDFDAEKKHITYPTSDSE